MACAGCGKLNGMQESNVCLFCDIWLQVVYLTSFVHAQDGRTPFLKAASNGHVEIAQMLMEKGANIEATDQGTVGGQCILVNNSWMVAMWSGEHPLGLLTAYANEGVGHCSGHGWSLESWHSIPKCRILNVLVLWRSCVSGLWWMKVAGRELECNYK